MNKQFSDMWRPQLGAGGITMDGIGSFVFLTDVDLGKNADIQLTMILRALEVAAEELAERGVPMPAHLRCFPTMLPEKQRTIQCFFGCVGWWLGASF